jgi:hypothetical protein
VDPSLKKCIKEFDNKTIAKGYLYVFLIQQGEVLVSLKLTVDKELTSLKARNDCFWFGFVGGREKGERRHVW